MGPKPEIADFENWLVTAPAAKPLRLLCQNICPASLGRCARAAYFGIGGYRRLMSLGSPVATIIPEDIFLASRRGNMEVIRTTLLRVHLSERRLKSISDIDACFGRAVDDEGQNF